MMRTTGLVRRSPSPWGAATGSTYDVLCPDGRIRRATITAEADTVWTIPARVTVKGQTVSGFMSSGYGDSYFGSFDTPANDDERPTFFFSAERGRRNEHLLPKWQEVAR